MLPVIIISCCAIWLLIQHRGCFVQREQEDKKTIVFLPVDFNLVLPPLLI